MLTFNQKINSFCNSSGLFLKYLMQMKIYWKQYLICDDISLLK